MPNQNSGDSSANASDMNMTLRISELLVGFGYNYPIDNHYRIEWYSNLGIRTVSLNVPMTEVKGMYTYKTIEEHPLNLGFGLKVGYSF